MTTITIIVMIVAIIFIVITISFNLLLAVGIETLDGLSEAWQKGFEGFKGPSSCTFK